VSEVRVLPLPKVTGLWQYENSKYPDVIKVQMSDGKVITYRMDVQQPHPCFEAAMNNLERMKKK
jgi:hypothetical protein